MLLFCSVLCMLKIYTVDQHQVQENVKICVTMNLVTHSLLNMLIDLILFLSIMDNILQFLKITFY